MASIEDKRLFHTSLGARYSSYRPCASRFLFRRILVLQPDITAYRDLHLAQGTHCHVPSHDVPDSADARLLGSIKVHFKDSKGHPLKTVEGNEGDSLLDIAHEYDIDLEGAYPRIHKYRSSRTDC
jgi:hypothetical protein